MITVTFNSLVVYRNNGEEHEKTRNQWKIL